MQCAVGVAGGISVLSLQQTSGKGMLAACCDAVKNFFHRAVAAFVLLQFLAGALAPVALSISVTPPHACCNRKAHHQEVELLASASCCHHNCIPLAPGSHFAGVAPRNAPRPFSQVEKFEAFAGPLPSYSTPDALQSGRAPPAI